MRAKLLFVIACLMLAALAPTVAALVACGPSPMPAGYDPKQVTGSCADACARLDSLGCPEARPTPGGHGCVEVCEATASLGQLLVGCVSRAQTVDAMRACHVGCR